MRMDSFIEVHNTTHMLVDNTQAIMGGRGEPAGMGREGAAVPSAEDCVPLLRVGSPPPAPWPFP